MKREQIIKSTLNVSNIIILLIGGIGMLVICYFLTLTSLEQEFPQIVPLILGFFFGLMGLICLIVLLYLEVIELDKERLVIRSILKTTKKIIYLKDIISYQEIERENKSRKFYDLTIFTENDKYMLSSSVIFNYDEFKQYLIKGKPINIQAEKLWEYQTNRIYRNISIGFIVVGLIFIYGSWNIANKEVTVIMPTELTTIKAIVNNHIEIDKGRSSHKLHIYTNEYPKFIFELSSYTFHASHAEQFIANVVKGDSIEVDLLTDTYAKKISKTKPLTFWDKSTNSNHIDIYGLRKGNQNFLPLEALNDEYKADASFGIIGTLTLALIGLGIMSLGVYLLLN